MDLSSAILIFICSTVVIAVCGTLLAKVADQLADLTGWGEALFGAVFLGGTTSLPGIITSVVAASNNHPQLAISNAIGGIAAQTVFLSIADIAYRKINLEHAAASFANLMQGILLICLLSLSLTAVAGPDIHVFGVHPFSLLLIILYVTGTRLISKASDHPMWKPKQTRATVNDVPDQKNLARLSLKKTTLKFILLAMLVGTAGYFVGKTGILIADETGLSEGMVGTLITAVATSLPELIVSIAAVRQRAVTLAVGNIIGGNTFDVLFIAFSDFAFLKGSIYHAITSNQIYIIALTILMTATLILGLLHREEKGMGKIGWESVALLLIYILGNGFIFFF